MTFYLDCSHTSHCQANTGIQRVARSLHGAIRDPWKAVVWDPYQCSWRETGPDEEALMQFSSCRKPREKRSKNWTAGQRLRGRFSRFFCPKYLFEEKSYLVTVEIFDAKRFIEYAKKRREGIRIAAVFHDAIPLILPELTPQKTVNRFKAYLKELAQFDAVFPVSLDSKKQLEKYWKIEGIVFNGVLQAVPLAVSFPKKPHISGNGESKKIKILTVGSLEGRKNHISWLYAAERLWNDGYVFELDIVGMLNRETGSDAAQYIEKLKGEGRPLEWYRCVSDDELLSFYQNCDFTVYPSLYEGFGLPILESLYYQKPCVCLGEGATGEVALQGGCLALKEMSPDSLVQGIKYLLNNPEKINHLRRECQSMRFRSWVEYVQDIETLLK